MDGKTWRQRDVDPLQVSTFLVCAAVCGSVALVGNTTVSFVRSCELGEKLTSAAIDLEGVPKPTQI